MPRLPDYLWGIETLLRAEHNRQATSLPDYLWGIETSNQALIEGASFRFQTTYEELKHYFRLSLFVDLLCFQTTYEELKRTWYMHSYSDDVMLPDYLWGIETVLPVSLCSESQGFQTTYEELKHEQFAIQFHRLRFQTTYEELKHYSGWHPDAYDGSFQTTYEELKQEIKSGWSFEKTGLPDYLWGIETWWNQTIELDLLVLPDYLWGIETRFRRWRSVQGKRRASRLPMRNWNFSP